MVHIDTDISKLLQIPDSQYHRAVSTKLYPVQLVRSSMLTHALLSLPEQAIS